MKYVNRMIAILKPKPAYLDWINSLPDRTEPITLEELVEDATCFLIPKYESIEKGRNFIMKNSSKVFDVELSGWDISGKYWPIGRDEELFNAFFDIEVHTEAIDMMKGPLEREDYA